MADEQDSSNSNTNHARKRGPMTEKQRLNKQQRFLRLFRECANIKASCKYAGIDRTTYYEWRDKDEGFKALLPDAEQDANDTLELAANDRAVLGVPSYVVSQGRLVYHEVPLFNKDGTPQLDKFGKQEYGRGEPVIERKYSDTLAITLLKARMPDKYREKSSIEHTGKDGGAIKIDRTDYSKLSDEELAILERMAEKAKDGDS